MQGIATISAGYVLTRWINRPEYLDRSLFPDRMVSVSDFVAPLLPAVPAGWLEAADVPHGRFAGYADSAQGKLLWALAADLERIGLEAGLSARLADVLAAAAARGDFEAPSAFTSIAAVRRMLQNVGERPEGAVVLGVEVPPDLVDEILVSDGGISGFSRLSLEHAVPESGGQPLGWDVYRPFGGEMHPWVREPGALELVQSGEFATNEFGLLPDRLTAELVAHRMEDQAPGDRWFPFGLTAYAL